MGDASAAFQEDAKGRIESAYRLLKYAINNNLLVGDEIIKTINTLKFDLAETGGITVDNSIKLDAAIRDLTKVTYPTTIYTIKYTLELKFGRRAQYGYFVITALTIAASCLSYYMMMSSQVPGAWPMALAIGMGMLGSELSLYFIFLGITKELALSEGDLPKQIARIMLGAVVGYLGYVMFSMDSFGSLALNKALNALPNDQKFYFVLPFLMGYSVRLVFGILNKAIKSAEMTLGLEDKSDDIALRNRQRQIP